MGLLDDAIREHLELKRRRGADAEEVSRLEQEALGPPRRGEFAGAATPAEPAEPVEAHEPSEPDEPMEEVEPLETVDPREPEPVDEDPVVAVRAEPAPLDQPTAEHAPPEADPSAADPPAEGEDVLEETPDFLQETPEHDRLWFEQKPPRDFDFD